MVYKENGGIYEGPWDNDKKQTTKDLEGCSEGKFTWADGTVYTGEFKNDKISGFGKIIYKRSGAIYEGHWKDNKKDSDNKESKMTYSDGSTYVGTMKNDKREGHGVMTWPKDGSSYVGNFSADKRHG